MLPMTLAARKRAREGSAGRTHRKGFVTHDMAPLAIETRQNILMPKWRISVCENE